ncbi:MAG: hypothetical protein KAG14_00840 [Mycoplasmataceae bacterium]|nr:hypothetical protein [Mycoplasmataceae bacterium]
MRKTLMTIGIFTAVVAPFSLVVSCAKEEPKVLSPLTKTQETLINKDMMKFKHFNQSITIPVPMLTLNSHPSEAFLGWLVGHDEFPNSTAGVWRDFKVIDINHQGTLHMQITFSLVNHPNSETKSIIYRITGFKTT